MTRKQMARAYLAAEHSDPTRPEQCLAREAIRLGILDGMIDFDPITDMLTITDKGRADAKRCGYNIPRLH